MFTTGDGFNRVREVFRCGTKMAGSKGGLIPQLPVGYFLGGANGIDKDDLWVDGWDKKEMRGVVWADNARPRRDDI